MRKRCMMLALSLVLAFSLFWICTTDMVSASSFGAPCHHPPVVHPRPHPPIHHPHPIPKPKTLPCVACTAKPIRISIDRWCGGVHTKLVLVI